MTQQVENELIKSRSIAGTSDGRGERASDEVKWVEDIQVPEGRQLSFEVPVLEKNLKKKF